MNYGVYVWDFTGEVYNLRERYNDFEKLAISLLHPHHLTQQGISYPFLLVKKFEGEPPETLTTDQANQAKNALEE